jgi:peptidoglycan/xylan/chitin deacetylase (PgdA/CDA1 family)
MKRSDFIKIAGSLAVAAPVHAFSNTERKVHIVTLSFDDGFARSFREIAEIHEKFSLCACFNIIATGHWRNTEVKDDYMKEGQLGDFSLWNELQDRGHEVMPHGYRHAHLADLPLEEAKGLILDCLEIFSRELRGFEPKKAVFNFPYNQSSPEIEAWLSSVVMAFRTSGGGINPLPCAETVKITTTGSGPENCEQHLDGQIEKLLAQPEGWLVYNLHGLDEEGWGPIRATYLERLLDRLLEIDSVRIVPAARAIMQAKAEREAQE